MSVDLEGASCSEEAARLLPWYVNRRLSAADSERVSRHLEHCAICRSDLEHETAVRARMATDAPLEYAPQAGLARTLSRIDELGRDAALPAPPARAAMTPSSRPATLRWLAAAVVLQALTLGWVGSSLGSHPHDPARTGYETLANDRPVQSGAMAAGPHIRAVFDQTMTVAQLRDLLAADHLIVVSGPSEAGAFTLTPDPGHPDAPATALAALRRDARVLFAEPAVNDATRPP